MRDAAIAGKKVGAEEQSERLTVETHVSVSVPRKMDGTQTVPNVDEVAVVKPAVGNERTKAQNRPANALQTACDPRPAAIVRVASVVVGVETRGGNPGAGLACDDGHVEDVVEMSVGDDNAANGLALPTALAECAPQKNASADESSVEQIQSRCVAKDIVIERWCPDLENIGMQRHVGYEPRRPGSGDGERQAPMRQTRADARNPLKVVHVGNAHGSGVQNSTKCPSKSRTTSCQYNANRYCSDHRDLLQY
jgi:hypothetical protein